MSHSSLLQLVCTFVVRSPFDAQILPSWEQQGQGIEVKWSATSIIIDSLRAGQRGDVVIVTVAAMDELIEAGIIDASTRVELVESRIGLAVKSGEPHPDISTTEALVNTLQEARSVAYSLGGASGIYFKTLIEKLGIADEINRKASTILEGFSAEKLISGDASLALQQVSELLVVPGIEVIGTLPEDVQKVTSFSAAAFKEAKNPQLAKEFLKHLQTPEAAIAYRAKGLDPIF
ncbi:molybdate ABC transporter substrate-binding protein [Serratia sp. Leaf50]|nr:molybdate ABC transporter substrate-binding protein [Serratia sp. Leaf50]